MTNHETIGMLLGCAVGWLVPLLLFNLFCGRKMLVVHGSVGQKKVGYLRALCILTYAYAFGYYNTVLIRPHLRG